jgi:hypothetical protein
MAADDGWPKVWAQISDEELRNRRRHYLLLGANGANQRARCIAQLLAEADRRRKVEMVHGAKQWVRSPEPSKRE